MMRDAQRMRIRISSQPTIAAVGQGLHDRPTRYYSMNVVFSNTKIQMMCYIVHLLFPVYKPTNIARVELLCHLRKYCKSE